MAKRKSSVSKSTTTKPADQLAPAPTKSLFEQLADQKAAAPKPVEATQSLDKKEATPDLGGLDTQLYRLTEKQRIERVMALNGKLNESETYQTPLYWVLGEALIWAKETRNGAKKLIYGKHGDWQKNLEAWGVSRRRATDAMSINKWLTADECVTLPVTDAAELARQRRREKQGKGKSDTWEKQSKGAPLTRREQTPAKRLLELADMDRALEVLDLVKQGVPTIEDQRTEARHTVAYIRARLFDLIGKKHMTLPDPDAIKNTPAKAILDAKEILAKQLRYAMRHQEEQVKKGAALQTELAELTKEVKVEVEGKLDHEPKPVEQSVENIQPGCF